MHKIWNAIGRVAYWVIYPAQITLLPRSQRARVALVHGDKILAVKAWLGDGRWQLPGGGLRGQEDPAVGAQRELFEETALMLPIESLVNPQSREFREGIKHFPYQLFTVNSNQILPAVKQWPEIIACEWVEMATLTAKNASDDILEAVGRRGAPDDNNPV